MPYNRSNYKIGHKSHFIRKKAAQNIFNAVDFALYLEKPLNYFIVINLVGAPQYDHKSALDEIMQKYRRWNAYRNRNFRKDVEEDLKPLWVYTLENNLGDNPHANWLVHVPDGCINDFKKKLHLWCQRVLGNYSKGDVYIDEVNIDAYKQPANYILKGIDPFHMQRFHLSKFNKGPQGVVYGCRARPSNALNTSARKKANFNASDFRRQKMEDLLEDNLKIKVTNLNRTFTYAKLNRTETRSQSYFSRTFLENY